MNGVALRPGLCGASEVDQTRLTESTPEACLLTAQQCEVSFLILLAPSHFRRRIEQVV